MFKIEFQYDSRLDTLGNDVWNAVVDKLTDLTARVHEKVLDNVSGKILQKQTGQLADSIMQRISYGEKTVTGTVYVSPETPKAWALEKGGEGFYEIYPTKANVLRYYNKEGKKVFAKHVNHPPSKDFGYLREAFEEMAPLIPTELADTVQRALSGELR